MVEMGGSYVRIFLNDCKYCMLRTTRCSSRRPGRLRTSYRVQVNRRLPQSRRVHCLLWFSYAIPEIRHSPSRFVKFLQHCRMGADTRIRRFHGGTSSYRVRTTLSSSRIEEPFQNSAYVTICEQIARVIVLHLFLKICIPRRHSCCCCSLSCCDNHNEVTQIYADPTCIGCGLTLTSQNALFESAIVNAAQVQ